MERRLYTPRRGLITRVQPQPVQTFHRQGRPVSHHHHRHHRHRG